MDDSDQSIEKPRWLVEQKAGCITTLKCCSDAYKYKNDENKSWELTLDNIFT